MHELAGREKVLMMHMTIYYSTIISVVCSQQDFCTGPFFIMYACIFCSQGTRAVITNGLWGLSALFLGVESFVVFLFRPCGLRLTR